jgi:hypothetical protein
MGHDPRWCFEHGVEVWEFRVPDTGARISIPVTTALVAVATPLRVLRGATAQARSENPAAAFRRRLVPHKGEDGVYEWREV